MPSVTCTHAHTHDSTHMYKARVPCEQMHGNIHACTDFVNVESSHEGVTGVCHMQLATAAGLPTCGSVLPEVLAEICPDCVTEQACGQGFPGYRMLPSRRGHMTVASVPYRTPMTQRAWGKLESYAQRVTRLPLSPAFRASCRQSLCFSKLGTLLKAECWGDGA